MPYMKIHITIAFSRLFFSARSRISCIDLSAAGSMRLNLTKLKFYFTDLSISHYFPKNK